MRAVVIHLLLKLKKYVKDQTVSVTTSFSALAKSITQAGERVTSAGTSVDNATTNINTALTMVNSLKSVDPTKLKHLTQVLNANETVSVNRPCIVFLIACYKHSTFVITFDGKPFSWPEEYTGTVASIRAGQNMEWISGWGTVAEYPFPILCQSSLTVKSTSASNGLRIVYIEL